MSISADAFVTKIIVKGPDGKEHQFDTKQEAVDFLRRPKVEEALKAVTGGNAELTTWLMDNQEGIEMAFETGTVRRVTKQEHKKMGLALDFIAEQMKDQKGAAFAVENIAAIKDSFRWPSVKRLKPEEKTTAIRNGLVALSNGNAKLAQWVIDNQEKVMEAFEAGKVKREVHPAAAEALATWRASEKAKKEAAAAAAAAADQAVPAA